MTNRLLIFTLLLCGLFTQTVVLAEPGDVETKHDYLIHAWQTDKGLPQNWVSSIAQTPDGYLWVGTRYGGLARFDGARFVSFNQQNTEELRDVQVEHLSVDESGRLWILMGNESVTAFQHGRFQLFRPPRIEPHLRLAEALCVRSNSILFAGEQAYLGKLDLSTGSRWELLDPRPMMEPDPLTFSLDHDGAVWFITQGKRLGCFSSNHFDFVSQGLPETSAVALARDATRQIWVATPHHLMTRDGNDFVDRTPTNGPTPEKILQISFSRDGGLWVLEKKRLRKFLNDRWAVEIQSEELLDSITSGTFSLHGDARGNAWLVANGRGLLHCKSDGTAHLLTERSGLPSRFITCWFQDAEGDIWIGLHGGGIAQIRERFFRALGQGDGLPDKVVSSVCVDADGALWTGTMSGELARWKNGRFVKAFLPASENDPNESVTVFPATDGGVWIGTLNHGLMQFRDGKISRPQASFGNIRVLFNDSHERLWIGQLTGLYCFDHGTVKQYGSAEGFVDLHAVGDIAEDASGALWIGTGPGELWKYFEGKFTRFTPPTDWPAVRFSAVMPDTNGAVWIGTLGGGLLRFSNGHFTRCLKTDGLPDNNVSQLLDSHDGYLWGGTYAGIFRVSRNALESVIAGKESNLRCRVYGQFDGLPALECSSGFQPSCWRSTNGKLWFSTANGVASVDPLTSVPNQNPPTVIIEDMLVDGRLMDVPPHIGAPLKTLKSTVPVIIPPGRHYVQFRYTGLNFAAPDGVRFRVKLEGGDDKWQLTDGQRLIGYGPLQPGNYHFRVAACNNDGIWNEEGDTLAFTVMPYFWETWWFKAFLGMVTFATLGFVVALVQRQRFQRRLEGVQRQREMEQERARIARDLHDDLGTSLTRISMLSALANREKTTSEEAKELIQQVRGCAREMVIALDEIVWAVNPKNDSLPGLVSYLGHFAEEFYRPTDIRFRMDIPSQLPTLPLSTESRHNLFLAFKEAINNVARHSSATQVCMRVKILASEFVIQVEDNGHGFEIQNGQSSQTGNGLFNMKRRLEQIGGRAEVQSAPSTGTVITFQAPLGNI
ncbi:sensor histidine kinase [Pedosphaera parvula]|uniref:Histidine kinase n=1 Tax=Pedosphaera parvula (strain Ellin514) TaxID=320771 RepID=B9XA53_PEDPL|nr:sensor histidine kinase [Pedosphaera parvula]EEF63394.1 histidine kinase [Pedosphaera parvula Ellin514]